MDINSLFQNPNDCCGLYTEDLQQLIAEYYFQASPMIFGISDEIYAAEIYGNRNLEQLYNKGQDFNYLLMLLVIIYLERQDDILFSDDGEDQGIEYYYEAHNLACIRSTFICKGYDIINLLRVFDMDPDKPDLPLDGINYMHITLQPSNHNRFIIR